MGAQRLRQEHADEHPRLPRPPDRRRILARRRGGLAACPTDDRADVRNAKIGFVFQSFNLLPATSALDNVMMPLTYTADARLRPRGAGARAMELLERVGLGDRLDHHPSQLSGGQQQRVAIARSLVNSPPLLFADEPTGNLDSRTSEEVLQMFQQLNDEEGITIILVTHDAEVADHAKRTIRINDGLIEAGAFDERRRRCDRRCDAATAEVTR